MIRPYSSIILLLTISNIFSQKELNIRSLINDNGTYKKIDSKELANGSNYDIVKNKKVNMGRLLNGKKHGHWVEMHHDHRRLEETYKHGLLDGSVSLYYKNGQREWRHTYNNGILDGPYTKWYKNGQRSVEGAFENGDAVGLWAWWNKQGKITKKEIFKKGTRGSLTGYKEYISKYVISKP